MEADKGSEVLQMMPPNIQEQVVERIAAMETTPMNQIQLVADTLESRMGKKQQSPRVKTGGVKSAADLLNWFDKENSKELLNSLVYFNQPPEAPITYLKNNGPRMRLSYVIGNTGKILSAAEINGGWGHKNPVVMSQLGYQFEGSYLSAGDFQALVEGMIFINGIEKEMFSPSFALLNGFRSSKNGWEFGFGPTFRLTKMAKGYYIGDTLGGNDYDVVEDWRLASAWEGPGQNPYPSKDRTDARGTTRLKTGWVWAVGRTFHSGYLNIPVNKPRYK